MIITHDEFNELAKLSIPVSMDLAEILSSYIEDSENYLINRIIGSEAFANYDNYYTEIKEACMNFIVAKSLSDGLARLNVEITPSGLAVINSDNLAPASVSRTDAFKKSLVQRLFVSYDTLIDNLLRYPYANDIWSETYCGMDLSHHIVYKAVDFGNTNVNLSYLFTKTNYIESQLIIIFGAVINDLIVKNHTFVASPIERKLYTMLHDIILYALDSMQVGVTITLNLQPQIDTITNFLNDNLTKFPMWENSEQYQSSRIQFKNQHDDRTFFF